MTGRARGRQRKVPWYEVTPDRAFWLFAVFAVVVLLMGGGSRHDIASVGPLRAISALFLSIAIYFQTGKSFKRVRAPIYIILALSLWMAIQLIPLPPSWWTALHGRETISQVGGLLGLQDIWRPITLSPVRTLNSLASLVIPLTGLMLLALLDENGWRRVPMLIVLAGVASASLGIAQVTLGGLPGLYLYEITNDGSAVGFFSNRNHNALFLNIALLFTILRDRQGGGRRAPSSLYVAAGQLILLLGILINGSRFGFFLLGVVALIFAGRQLLAARNRSKHSSAGGARQILMGLLASIAAFGLVAMFILLDRIPALTRLLEHDAAQDLRAQSLSTVWAMARDNLPFGVGFGAFEHAYRIVEPDGLLGPAYFNQAHDDWLQIIVEGGIPAVIILVVGLFLVGRRGWDIWRARGASPAGLSAPLLGFLTLVMIGMHSVVDYPLRTPIMMVVAAVALGLIFRPRGGIARG